jgi:adenine-specific DNA-methyltransferase
VWVESPDGKEYRKISEEEFNNPAFIPIGWRVFRPGPLTSPGASLNARNEITLHGRKFTPGANRHWSIGADDTEALDRLGRVMIIGNTPCSKLYLKDFPVSPLKNVWPDTGGSGFAEKPLYVVQTDSLVIQRCMLMTTDPGDLVLDPTCGSGTTAYVAEQWGRRWITIDTSRVPLALGRQRLLTATFPYYELLDESAGVAGGFKYRRRQNKKGEEVGGIIPHVTLKGIANNESAEEEVLVDRPDEVEGVVRVSGPFVVEATIPTPADFEADGTEDSRASSPEEFQSHIERMLEALRRSPVLRLPNNQSVTFKNVRQPAKTLSLNAEAEIVTKTVEDLGEEADTQKSLEMKAGPLAAFVFGPENGAVSEQMVFQAAREAYAKSYQHLYVIGFAAEDAASKLIQNCEAAVGIAATYVAATMDLQMADLLKTTRASQIFSVTGAPEIKLRKIDKKSSEGAELYQVQLLGMDIFDAVTMENTHRSGDDVPAWFLDTDYNELAFFVAQAFFPRTAAWDNLKRELRGVYAESVWEHLAGTTSEPFAAGAHKQIAVKVIDDRGNELLVVKKLGEAEEPI